jgi:hypothetical protein
MSGEISNWSIERIYLYQHKNKLAAEHNKKQTPSTATSVSSCMAPACLVKRSTSWVHRENLFSKLASAISKFYKKNTERSYATDKNKRYVLVW